MKNHIHAARRHVPLRGVFWALPPHRRHISLRKWLIRIAFLILFVAAFIAVAYTTVYLADYYLAE